jgi:hypothetical protein
MSPAGPKLAGKACQTQGAEHQAWTVVGWWRY